MKHIWLSTACHTQKIGYTLWAHWSSHTTTEDMLNKFIWGILAAGIWGFILFYFILFFFLLYLQSLNVHVRLWWARILIQGILAWAASKCDHVFSFSLVFYVFWFIMYSFIFYACNPVCLQSMYVHTKLCWARILLQGILAAINMIMFFCLFVFIFYACDPINL